jgi:flagellar motor switch protein FliN/FliY
MPGQDALDQQHAADTTGAAGSLAELRQMNDVPIELAAEIGRTRMTVGQALEIRVGSIITVDHLASQPVHLLVNGVPIARGEVVVIDEQFGLRVTDVLGALQERP